MMQFDVQKDEHPVKFLLEKLTDGVYAASGTFLEIPLLAMWYTRPADGLPLLQDWLGTAADIFNNGFEALREPMEVKLRGQIQATGGLQLSFGALVPTKGVGRTSIILFAVVYSFLVLKDGMSVDELADFVRWLKTVATVGGILMMEGHSSHYEWRRMQVHEQQDPNKFGGGDDGFRSAFLASINEYNSYGAAATNAKYQIDESTAMLLYGFKVGVCSEAWCLLERHLHKNKFENSAFSRDTLLDTRDFHSEANDMLAIKDPAFQPNDLAMWSENAPVIQQEATALKQADETLSKLNKDARKAAWEMDTLRLARDIAQLGKLYAAEVKSERAMRAQKVLHLKNQNTIGASLVSAFMSQGLVHRSGKQAELHRITEQFITDVSGEDAAMCVWADCTKLGRLSNCDLNFLAEMMQLVLAKKPTQSVGVVICPYLVSEKVNNGQRGEVRRIEDKLDAKSLFSQMIAIRMDSPPTAKKVPLQFLGWLVFQDDTLSDNIFNSCQLMSDRATRGCLPWLAESSYVIPAAEKDNLPHASEGQRT
ncbi:unnamed protein product [Effrenium voratum]|nr:unnamed protein product [Effrenium voratum]